MKRYPKILPLTDEIDLGEYFYIFDKLDGSNIRVEWRPWSTSRPTAPARWCSQTAP